MSLAIMDAAALECFDSICKTVAARGKGLTITQIGDAGALARELEKSDPSVDRVESFWTRLGLEASDSRGKVSTGVGHL